LNKLKFVNNTKEFTQVLFLVSLLSLTACGGVPKNKSSQDAQQTAKQELEVIKELDEPEVDPNLPNVELDQKTLALKQQHYWH